MPYQERPARLEVIKDVLAQDARFQFIEPNDFGMQYIDAIHDASYVDFLKTKSTTLPKTKPLYPSYFITDTYAPIVRGTYAAAKSAADVALTGAALLVGGAAHAYSMCRPPGHHAEYKSMGGYCYFNNAAIAADYLSAHGRVAILDIDFHHGNGTQHTFYERSDVLYVSIHADPKKSYPYISGWANETGKAEGIGYTINYPLPLKTTDTQYGKTLNHALADIKTYQPDFLVISLGFDTYKDDPMGGFSLTVPFYTSMGNKIANLALPTLIIQEGGYDVSQLGLMAHNFLQEFITPRYLTKNSS